MLALALRDSRGQALLGVLVQASTTCRSTGREGVTGLAAREGVGVTNAIPIVPSLLSLLRSLV